MSEDEDLKKAQFFFNYTEKIDSLVQKAHDKLYDKIKDMTTIVTALIPVLFGFGYFCLNNEHFIRLLIPIGITLICLGFAVIQGFYILWFNQYTYNEPFELIQKYHDQDLTFITLKTSVSWADVINENIEYHNDRAKKYKWMLVTIGLGLINLIFVFWLAIFSFY